MGDDLELLSLFNENVCFCTNVLGLNGKHDLLRKKLPLTSLSKLLLRCLLEILEMWFL